MQPKTRNAIELAGAICIGLLVFWVLLNLQNQIGFMPAFALTFATVIVLVRMYKGKVP